jgi:transposase
MIKTLRAKLQLKGVSKELVSAFESAVRMDAEVPLLKKLKWVEHRELDLSDASALWQEKYLNEKEKCDRFELGDSLRVKRIQELEQLVAKQSAQIADMQKQIFGDKSERGASCTGTNKASGDSTGTGKRGKKIGSQGHGRKKDADLETRNVKHDILSKDKHCGCGGEYELIDLPPKESNETHLEEIAVNLKHSRRTVMRRCKACGEKASIKTAPKPAQLIPRGKYTVDFWRYVLEEKYWLQRPLNRVIQKLSSLGINARPGTLTSALKALHDVRIFEVIYEAILERSRAAAQRHMDDTGWKVFAEAEGKQSNRWYMWVSVTDDTTSFILDPRRSNEVIAEHLSGVAEGIIICDRHSSFKKFGRTSKFVIAFCWIHQRRDLIKLKDGYPEHFEWAESWLERLEMVRLQNKVRVAALGNIDEFKVHDDLLRSMITQLKTDIDLQLKNKNLVKERKDELQSLTNHWTGLTQFVNNPLIPMDNNTAERAIRELVLARKSYYGSRAEWSGDMTSHLLSIFATLEQNNVNPHDWLRDYLQACANNDGLPPPDKALQKYLPWNYRPEQLSNQSNPSGLTITLLPEEDKVSTTQI